MLAATAEEGGREKERETRRRRDARRERQEDRVSSPENQPKPARGATRRGTRAAGQALPRLPCPLSCLSKWALAAVNSGYQRGWHMKRWICSGPPSMTAAVGWPHVSQSAATPEGQARHFDVRAETQIRQGGSGQSDNSGVHIMALAILAVPLLVAVLCSTNKRGKGKLKEKHSCAVGRNGS